MSYYHIRNKVKVGLDLSIYATKQELKDAAGDNKTNLAAKNA